jgi:hypothetical protein
MTMDVIVAARRRTRRLVACVGVVLVGVAGVAVLGWLRSPPAPDPAMLPDGAAGAIPSASPAPDPATGAMLPADVTWTRLAGVELPVSATTGPAQITGDLARGFAHSPAGAAVAALHLLVRTTAQVGPGVFEPTIDEQVTGEHATAMRYVVGDLYRRGAAQAGLAYGQPLAELPARLVGIRLDSYTDARADLSVLTAAPDASGVTYYAATPVAVVWADGDWRLLAPPGGRWDELVRIVDPANTASYTQITAR